MPEVQYSSSIARYLDLRQTQAEKIADLAKTNQALIETWSAAQVEVDKLLAEKLAAINSDICSEAEAHASLVGLENENTDPKSVGVYPLTDLRHHLNQVSQNIKGGGETRDYLRLLCPTHFPEPADFDCKWTRGRAVEKVGESWVAISDREVFSDYQVQRIITPAICRLFDLPVIEKPRNS